MSSDKSTANTDNNDKMRIFTEVRKCNRQMDLWIFSNTPPFPYCYYNRLTDYNYALNQYNTCLNNIPGYKRD